MARTTTRAKKTRTKKRTQSSSEEFGIQEFKKCPKCSSDKGFYIYLIPKKGKRKNNFDLRFGCSKCSQKYKTGLIIDK